MDEGAERDHRAGRRRDGRREQQCAAEQVVRDCAEEGGEYAEEVGGPEVARADEEHVLRDLSLSLSLDLLTVVFRAGVYEGNGR